MEVINIKFWTIFGVLALAIGSLAGLFFYRHEKMKDELQGYTYRNW